MKKQIYIGGHMLAKADQILRGIERDTINTLDGYKAYAPQDDASINDKATADNSDLAERVVINDTKGIDAANICIFDVHSYAQGTLVEIGQVFGMKHLSKLITKIIADNKDPNTSLNLIAELTKTVTDKKIYCQCSDVRRANTEIEEGDRKSFSHNAYVYGVVLALSDGEGFVSFEDIIEDIKKRAI